MKLLSHRHFIQHVIHLSIVPPNALGKLSVMFLISIELLLGILLNARILVFYVLFSLLLLMIGLTVLVVILIKKGKSSEDCGCYGRFYKEKLNASKVISNLIWISLILIAFFLPRDNSSFFANFLALLFMITRFAILRLNQFFTSFSLFKERL